MNEAYAIRRNVCIEKADQAYAQAKSYYVAGEIRRAQQEMKYVEELMIRSTYFHMMIHDS